MSTCIWEFKRGSRLGELCGKKTSSNAEYCMQHSKLTQKKQANQANVSGIIAEMNADITDSRVEDKVNESKFLIVINTNQTADSLGEAGLAQFKKFIDYLFGADPQILDFIDDNQSKLTMAEVIDSGVGDKILDYRAGYAFEAGKKMNRIHANGFCVIHHKLFIRVKVTSLRNLCRGYLGYTCNVKVTCPEHLSDGLEQYAYKELSSH